MHIAVTGLSAAVLLLLLLVLVLAIEVVASFRRSTSAPVTYGDVSKIVVIVPAHDEAVGIARILESIKQELAPTDRLLVVADNCSDATAEIARRAGADVVERHDAGLRGKGYALEFGIRHLAQAPPDIVVVIDADCTPAKNSIHALAGLVAATGRPVQGLYLLHLAGPDPSQSLKVALIAWRLKAYLRPLGLKNLGLPCGLGGTGMAFPWPLLASLNLHTGNIVEDIALGLECAAKRRAPLFCPEAVFTSPWPISTEAQQTQRARWETGHLNMIARQVPRLLWRALLTRNLGLFVIACDLAVPPLAFLALSILVLLAAAVVVVLAGGPVSCLVAALLTALIFGGTVALVWWRAGRDLIAINEFGSAGRYAISKIALYAQVVRGRQVTWTRTKRD